MKNRPRLTLAASRWNASESIPYLNMSNLDQQHPFRFRKALDLMGLKLPNINRPLTVPTRSGRPN